MISSNESTTSPQSGTSTDEGSVAKGCLVTIGFSLAFYGVLYLTIRLLTS